MVAGEAHAADARAASEGAARAIGAYTSVAKQHAHDPTARVPTIEGVVTGRGDFIRAKKVRAWVGLPVPTSQPVAGYVNAVAPHPTPPPSPFLLRALVSASIGGDHHWHISPRHGARRHGEIPGGAAQARLR